MAITNAFESEIWGSTPKAPPLITPTSPKDLFTEDYNRRVEGLVRGPDAGRFQDQEDFEINPQATLRLFYDSTFKVGNENSFEIISSGFEKSIDSAVKQMNEYVATAQAAKAAIEAAIKQDEDARKAAQEAYDAEYKKHQPFEDEYETYVENGVELKRLIASAEDKKAAAISAAEGERDRVWQEKCWKPTS